MTDFYRYRVGEATVMAFHEGGIDRPLEAGFVTNAPLDQVQAALADAFLPTDVLPITFTTLLVETGGQKILIDTGFGDSGPPSAGGTLRGLAAAGVARKAIDAVVISHFHGDHITGVRLKDGSLAYPNARLLVPEPEWAWWTDKDRVANAPAAMRPHFEGVQKAFGPESDRLERFGWGQEILPGLTALEAPGHTPGHTAFLLESAGAKLLILSDVTNHPALFVRHPDWAAAFDIDADLARATRHRLLGRAADEKVRVAFYHAPFPATGHIARTPEGFAFVPSQWGRA